MNNDDTATQWSIMQLLKNIEADLYELTWSDFHDVLLNDNSKVKVSIPIVCYHSCKKGIKIYICLFICVKEVQKG